MILKSLKNYQKLSNLSKNQRPPEILKLSGTKAQQKAPRQPLSTFDIHFYASAEAISTDIDIPGSTTQSKHTGTCNSRWKRRSHIFLYRISPSRLPLSVIEISEICSR
jgi:hypothetical protein